MKTYSLFAVGSNTNTRDYLDIFNMNLFLKLALLFLKNKVFNDNL